MTDFSEPTTNDPFLAVRSDHACFGCGDDNPIGLRLRFAPDADVVKASFIPGPDHQGYHGACTAGSSPPFSTRPWLGLQHTRESGR